MDVETVVAFTPERLLDYVRFERDAQALRLDPPLRFTAAEAAAEPAAPQGYMRSSRQFSLPAEEILDIISERPRLGMAVRGGVAERHLHEALERDPEVDERRARAARGPAGLHRRLRQGGRRVTVECKNASPKTYADGTPKVETQKTRASKGDPKSRLYDPSQFDVVAACMFGPLATLGVPLQALVELRMDTTLPGSHRADSAHRRILVTRP